MWWRAALASSPPPGLLCLPPWCWRVGAGFRSRLLEAAYAPGFWEVFLAPGLSRVEPHEVDLSTEFARGVRLGMPIASAPMDMVSGWEMAVALACRGGIGVIHRNMSVEEQVEAVRRVKEHPPVVLRGVFAYEDEPCGRVLDFMVSRGLRSLPVVGVDGGFRGYVRLVDLVDGCKGAPSTPVSRFVRGGRGYRVDEVGAARRDVVAGVVECAAVVSRGGVYLGSLCLEEAVEETVPALDEEGRLRVAAAVSPFDLERARRLEKAGVDVLVSDVAHFHNANVLRAASRLVRETSTAFVAGNLASYEAAVDVVTSLERVDGLRVGLGGGTICTTPEVTGAYVPTLYAVAAVRDALEEHGATNIPVIADGGIRSPADGVKALAAGAWCLMLGYALAGTDEAPAPLVRVGGRAFKPYRGMASRGAMERRFAVDRYARAAKRVEEGVEGLVPYRGPVAAVLREWIEALKAGLGYAGARSIPELWEKARFIRASRGERGLVLELGKGGGV